MRTWPDEGSWTAEAVARVVNEAIKVVITQKPRTNLARQAFINDNCAVEEFKNFL